MLVIPTAAQSLCLPRTYAALPGSSPTSTVPSPGWWPASRSAATRARSSPLMVSSVALPSSVWAVTGGSLPCARRGPGSRLDPRPVRRRHEHGLTEVDPDAGEVESAQPDPVEVRAAQVGPVEQRAGEPRVAEVGAAQVGAAQVGLGQVGLAQPQPAEVELGEHGLPGDDVRP